MWPGLPAPFMSAPPSEGLSTFAFSLNKVDIFPEPSVTWQTETRAVPFAGVRWELQDWALGLHGGPLAAHPSTSLPSYEWASCKILFPSVSKSSNFTNIPVIMACCSFHCKWCPASLGLALRARSWEWASGAAMLKQTSLVKATWKSAWMSALEGQPGAISWHAVISQCHERCDHEPHDKGAVKPCVRPEGAMPIPSSRCRALLQGPVDLLQSA